MEIFNRVGTATSPIFANDDTTAAFPEFHSDGLKGALAATAGRKSTVSGTKAACETNALEQRTLLTGVQLPVKISKHLESTRRNHLQQAMLWIFVPTPMLAYRRPRASLDRCTHGNANRNEQTMLFGCSTREKFHTQAMPRIRYKVQDDSNVLPETLRCSTRSLSHLRPSTLTLRPSSAHVIFSVC